MRVPLVGAVSYSNKIIVLQITELSLQASVSHDADQGMRFLSLRVGTFTGPGD
jgi:hypothetical protein